MPSKSTLPSRVSRVQAFVWQAAPALGIFLVARLAMFIAFIVFLQIRTNETLFERLQKFDGEWYTRIARNGYGFTRVVGEYSYSDAAFFPLQPALVRLGMACGFDPYLAGILINNVGGIFAAAGIFAVATHLLNRQAALFTVAIWGSLPPSGILFFPYTEGLFTALAAWALYAAVKKNWVSAAVLTVLAGLTRPHGMPLAAAIVLAAIWSLWKQQKLVGRTIAAILIAPLGFASYIAWVGFKQGDIFGYFQVQSGWGNGVDGGKQLLNWISQYLSSSPLAGILIVLGFAAVIALLVAVFRQGWPAPVLLYTTLLVVMSLITAGAFGSRPRYFLPGFPLVFGPAAWAAGLPQDRKYLLMGAVIVLGATAGAWAMTNSTPF